MRQATIERKTSETVIRAILCIDGRGKYHVSTGIRFFDHLTDPPVMLENPTVIEGDRVTHLIYRVRRPADASPRGVHS